jgi:hypothetical protein
LTVLEDRSRKESAVRKIPFISSVVKSSTDNRWEEVRKSFLSSGDLSLLVEKAASIPDISEKNLIPRLRGLTDKKFNPAVAMEMYKKLRKSR